MAPLPTLEPAKAPGAPQPGEPGFKAPEKPGKSAAEMEKEEEDDEKLRIKREIEKEEREGPPKKVRPLEVTTHLFLGYEKEKEEDPDLHLALKIKLPPSWDERSVAEAVVKPFVDAYDKKHPDNPASARGPFAQVKVRVWAGPRPSAADQFLDHERFGIEDIRIAERPIWCLLDVDEPVSVLRKRAYNLLKPAIVLELVVAESTALVLKTMPSTALVHPGDSLIGMLMDVDTDLEDMHDLVDKAVEGGELAYLGLVSARDRFGRSALHLAVTRGDATLCRKLLRRREDVMSFDSNRDSALTTACLAGRAVIVKDLLDMGALVHEKNRDLMSPLQLAVVDEAPGNGEVVRMLVEAGAQIDARCWDVTPLMAAASSGHEWGLQVLLELGADTQIRNGYEMMALDYARCQETAQLIYDFMEGKLLPNQDLLKKTKAARAAQKQYAKFGMPGIGDEEKEPRLFQSVHMLPLTTAFEHIKAPMDWLEDFRETGEHYKEIRKIWRKMVLDHHPDKQPTTQSDEESDFHAAEFAKATASFESIDHFYATRHAKKIQDALDEEREEELKAAAAAANDAAAAATATGSAPEAAEATADADPASASATPAGAATAAGAAMASRPGGGGGKRVPQPPPAPDKHSSDAEKPSVRAQQAAMERASRPLILGQKVVVQGLASKPEYNGKLGVAKFFDREAGRYLVDMDLDDGIEGEKLRLRVREANLVLVQEGMGAVALD